jgi:hypothetical protein
LTASNHRDVSANFPHSAGDFSRGTASASTHTKKPPMVAGIRQRPMLDYLNAFAVEKMLPSQWQQRKSLPGLASDIP